MNENMKAVDVLAVMDMALLYIEEAHEIHPGDFKPGVGKRNTGKVIEARAAVVDAVEALKLAERTISATLAARGYQNGECTDGWVQEVRDEVAALVPIRAALSRCGGAK